jgi:hypothetical protein
MVAFAETARTLSVRPDGNDLDVHEVEAVSAPPNTTSASESTCVPIG